jgi:hypothetical protein
MTGQMSFDDLPPLDHMVRRGGQDTSQGAAVIAIFNLKGNREAAMAALAQAGESGLTDFELAAVTGVQQTSIGKRRKELVDLGLVASVLDPAAGKPATRPSPSGSPSMVWRATADGISRALASHLDAENRKAG